MKGEEVKEPSSIPPFNLWDITEPKNLQSFGCIWLYYIRGLILAKSRRFKEAENSLRLAQKNLENVFGVDPKRHVQALKFETEVFSQFEMWKHKECIAAAR